MSEARLPTKLWIDAVLAPLNGRGIFYYIHQAGNNGSGLILLKLTDTKGECKLLTQQRNFETDALDWVPALAQEDVAEVDADAYIARAKDRDPDLWVIEVEDPAMNNPFEES